MLVVKNLTKTYTHTEGKWPKKQQIQKHALNDLSFTANAGAIHGILGSNGAGKTTAFRILSTAITPDSGELELNGTDILTNPAECRAQLGFVSNISGLYHRLSVRENLRYFGKLNGIKGTELTNRVEALIERLAIGEYAHQRADALSAGQKQRAIIARAVLHQPTLMIFDEPTTGLDVVSAQTILNFMAEERDKGRIILFSTHHLHEVEALCETATILDQGVTQFTGTIDELKEGHATLFDAFLSHLPSHHEEA